MANFVKLIIAISRGLIRDQRSRRSAMFFAMLGALVVLFFGATVLDGALRERPLLFVVYWGACAWVTLLAVLLAIFDVLVIRATARRERRAMEEECLRTNSKDEDAD